MDQIVVTDFTDSVLNVINAVRNAASIRELQNAMAEAALQHVYTRSAYYSVPSIVDADEESTDSLVVSTLQAFFSDPTNLESDAVRLAMSPHATHCEAILLEGEVEIKYQFKYLELPSVSALIDGALVVQGQVLQIGYRPALCNLFFGGQEPDLDIAPWEFIFEDAGVGSEHGGTFTIPIRSIPTSANIGGIRVRVFVGLFNQALEALYTDPSDEAKSHFMSPENLSAIKATGADGTGSVESAPYVVALEFTVGVHNLQPSLSSIELDVGGDEFAAMDSAKTQAQVLAAVRVALDGDEMSQLRAQGFELICLHVTPNGHRTDNEGAWPFYIMGKYGPAANGGITSISFLTVPRHTAGAVDANEENDKMGAKLPPALEERESGVLVETFLQYDLAACTSEDPGREHVYLQIQTTLQPKRSELVYERVTMISASDVEEQSNAPGVVARSDDNSVNVFLSTLDASGYSYVPLPPSLAASLGFIYPNAGLLLEKLSSGQVQGEALGHASGSAWGSVEDEAALQAAAEAEEAVEEAVHARANAGGVDGEDDNMSHMTGSDNGEEEVELNELQMAEQLEEKLAALLEEQQQLENDNAELQKKTIVLVARERAMLQGQKAGKDGTGATNEDEPEATNDRTAEKEKALLETLSSIVTSRAKIAQQTADYDQLSHDLQTRLDDREYKANEISESFAKFKSEILGKAGDARTSQPLSKKVIKQFEVAQAKRDEDLERVRLRNISMRTQLLRLERQLRSREQLAEGLHMIDFEQLKVENQTLYEKIEERTEELMKLSRKKTNTVQVLTHVREKLRFIEKSNLQLNKELGVVENDTMSRRGTLTGSKKNRDTVREDNKELKRKQGFASSSGLLVDYEKRTKALGDAHALLKELQEKYNAVAAQCAKDEAFVLSMRQGRTLTPSALPSGPGTGTRAMSVGTGVGLNHPPKSLPQTPYFPGARPESNGASAGNFFPPPRGA